MWPESRRIEGWCKKDEKTPVLFWWDETHAKQNFRSKAKLFQRFADVCPVWRNWTKVSCQWCECAMYPKFKSLLAGSHVGAVPHRLGRIGDSYATSASFWVSYGTNATYHYSQKNRVFIVVETKHWRIRWGNKNKKKMIEKFLTFPGDLKSWFFIGAFPKKKKCVESRTWLKDRMQENKKSQNARC